MNDHPTNNADGSSDPGSDRISQDRRILFDIGFAGKEGFEGVLAVAHNLEGASSDSRRSALFATADQLEGLIPVIQETSGVLRSIGARGVFPLEVPRRGDAGRVARAIARVKIWWVTR